MGPNQSIEIMLHHPVACGVASHVEVQNPPPIVANEEEAVKDAKGDSVDCENVHRGNDFAVIFEKCLPPSNPVGFFGARWTQRETVRSETSKPSICSSP